MEGLPNSSTEGRPGPGACDEEGRNVEQKPFRKAFVDDDEIHEPWTEREARTGCLWTYANKAWLRLMGLYFTDSVDREQDVFDVACWEAGWHVKHLPEYRLALRDRRGPDAFSK